MDRKFKMSVKKEKGLDLSGPFFIRHFETNKELIRTTFNMTPHVKCKAKLINLCTSYHSKYRVKITSLFGSNHDNYHFRKKVLTFGEN